MTSNLATLARSYVKSLQLAAPSIARLWAGDWAGAASYSSSMAWLPHTQVRAEAEP